MAGKKELDEYLEALWNMMEDGLSSLSYLIGNPTLDRNPEILEKLEEDFLVIIQDGNINLTEKGKEQARRLIRAHRIGERLVHDVLKVEFESSACEFEHLVHTELVDSICTLLGHPRECPHGMPIPEGECCRRSLRVVKSPVIPVCDMDAGQTARIAYVSTPDDRELHIIDGLQIRPGIEVKLHQKYPVIVIECEGSNIALDDGIAENIRVWGDSLSSSGNEGEGKFAGPHAGGKRTGFFWRPGKKRR